MLYSDHQSEVPPAFFCETFHFFPFLVKGIFHAFIVPDTKRNHCPKYLYYADVCDFVVPLGRKISVFVKKNGNLWHS